MEQEQQTPHKRRVRYKGKYPKKFEEKYKELQPEKYQDTIEHVIKKGKQSMNHFPLYKIPFYISYFLILRSQSCLHSCGVLLRKLPLS